VEEVEVVELILLEEVVLEQVDQVEEGMLLDRRVVQPLEPWL
jgi:hypothetical protein